jgi:hypothetical protein
MTDLESYLDRFGARLHDAKPPRRRRRGFALGGALAVATAAVVAVLLLAPGGSSRPVGPVDAIAAARRALDPNGVILHFRIRTDHPGNGITTTYAETWSAQDPQRWRLKSWNTDGPKMNRSAESAYARGERRDYSNKKLVITTGYEDYTPQTRLPTIFSQNGNDPDSDLRALLMSGKLKDQGEQQVGGRTVRRLSRDDGVRSMVVDVDPQTFVPLGGSISLRVPGNRKIPEHTMTFTVETFERLPISPDTEKLLTFTAPAGTRTVTRTAADIRRFQREYRKWRKTCKQRKKDNRLICPTPMPKLKGA